jgi:hypothetical protein
MHPVLLAYWPWALIALGMCITAYLVERYDVD